MLVVGLSIALRGPAAPAPEQEPSPEAEAEPPPEAETETEPATDAAAEEPPPDAQGDVVPAPEESTAATDAPSSMEAAPAAEASPAPTQVTTPEPLPAPVEAAPAPAYDTEIAPTQAAEDEDDGEQSFNRRGFLLSLGAGAGSCAAPLCSDIAAAGGARMEIGYRLGVLAVFGSWFAAGGSISENDFDIPSGVEIDGSLVFVDAGVGVHIFPVRQGRVDPYVGAMLGYSRVREKVGNDTEEFDLRFSRGVVRPTVGFDVYVHRVVAIGPRFDIDLPFAGQICDSTVQPECTDVADIIDDNASADADERLLRRTLPKPWTLMLQVRFTI